jgi:hypothetical protein
LRGAVVDRLPMAEDGALERVHCGIGSCNFLI